jgi:hypothetical protein
MDFFKQLQEFINNGMDSDEFDMYVYDNIVELEKYDSDVSDRIIELMENNPMYDFGVPGSLVFYLEEMEKDWSVYFDKLSASLNRNPSRHLVWCLNRLLNGVPKNDKVYHDGMNCLKSISDNTNTSEFIRENAKEFYEYQLKRKG